MSLFDRVLRPSPTVSDDAIARSLAALQGEIEPDPLFRRRLRTDAVNRFVAAREGIDRPVSARVARGQVGRLGRACLYASFTLGISAASVLAAAQEAIPGDALYGLKQRVEQLRIDVLPEHLQGELAAYALGERIEEMGRLAETGRLELAIAMAPAIEREFEHVAALGETVDQAGGSRISRHLLVLEGLLEKLPANARAAVENVLDRTRGNGPRGDGGRSPGNSDGAHGAGGGAAGGHPGPGAGTDLGSTPRPDRTPRPEPSVKPDPSVQPEPAIKPQPSAKPDPSVKPEPSAKPEGAPKPASPESAQPPNRPPRSHSSD